MVGELIVGQLSTAITTAIIMPVLNHFWNIIIAIILLIVGFIVGKVIGAAVKELMTKFKVDVHVKIKQDELRLSNLFSLLVKWIIYLLFISQAGDVLGITLVSVALNNLAMFLPNVMTAIIIMAAGYVIGKYIEDAVRGSRFSYSGLMAKVLFFFVVYVSIAVGLNALNKGLSAPLIDPTLINSILLIIVGSLGLGMAIAIGLGFKDMFSDIGDEVGTELVKSMKASEKKAKKR